VSSRFKSKGFDWVSFFFSGLTGLATFLILCILAVIIGNIVLEGIPYLSWRFVSSGVEQGMFNIQKSGVLPMILGTSARVILMTIFVIPVGVITAIYITEYAHTHSLLIRFIRGAVNNLAGVPSVVFGLFGLGFFIGFIGKHMDEILHPNVAQPIWSKPALLWASMTLAVMTLPVVIVATEESLKAIPQGLREASLALGATKLQTILRIVLPQALPGILTGGILAISRAAGEVAPIMFTGAAYFISGLPKSLSDQFMDLGYHIYILSTQSPNIEQTRPLLQATVLVLLMLTFALNFVAILIRAKIRKRMRAFH
jgi:phosphate transport system permease protein